MDGGEFITILLLGLAAARNENRPGPQGTPRVGEQAAGCVLALRSSDEARFSFSSA